MKPWPAIGLLLAACAGPAPTAQLSQSEPAVSTPVETTDVAAGNRAFGVELYRQLATDPGNIFISPISIAGAFGPVTAGAQGDTQAEINKVLRFPGDDALHPRLGGLLRGLERDEDGARVTIANALWVAQDFPIKKDFLDTARGNYGAEVANLDFRNGAAAAGRINEWVERETKRRIRNLINPRSLNARTVLVVTNAVHFLGDWTVPFEARHTRPLPFYLDGATSRDVPMMSDSRSVRYAEPGDVQIIDLPYKGERLSMSVILPKRRGGLREVEGRLDDRLLGRWLAALDAAPVREVQIVLPKVTVESAYQLVEPLKAMGMVAAFDPSRAKFRGIAEAPLVITQVVHKTFLRVDEKGTEAAAATGIGIEVTGARIGPPTVFRADHPYLLLIRDKPTGAVLFLGRIAAP
jgi:serpin B